MPIKDPVKKKEAQQRADAKRAPRTRNFATVIYLDSAPPDWRDKINEWHVAALVSPLHDRDINPDGTTKKPHYHVMVMFESPVEFEKVKPLFAEIGGVGREKINSARGYARYLCHLDNPEKAQYLPEDVICFAGADFISITNLPTDDIKMLKDIFAYISDNDIRSLAELLDLCSIYHSDWFGLITLSRCYIVDKYIKSLEWERSTEYVRGKAVFSKDE